MKPYQLDPSPSDTMNKHIGIAVAIAVAIAVPLISAAATTSISLPLVSLRLESSTTPERESPHLPFPQQPKTKTSAPLVQSQASLAPAAETLGPNLIPNPSVENGSGSLPTSWHKGGYGTNTRILTYPVVGSGGSGTRAIQVQVSGYQSGDAKWYFDSVAVKPSTTYELSDASLATVPSIITVAYALANGSMAYTNVATIPASSSFQTNTVRITTPATAASLTIYHLLKQNGTLATDDYSLREVTQTQTSGNLIANPGFETAGSNGLPQSWTKGGYGTNTRTLTYPVAGNPGNAARVTITNYASGDAKWVFDPVSIAPGTYTYSDSYQATLTSYLTAQFIRTDGSLSYLTIQTLPASAGWASAAGTFTVPSGVARVTIFHLIKGNGTLTIDNASLTGTGSGGGGGNVFSTGAVTFRFDDDLSSQYDNALPKLESDGFKATYYIITHETGNDGFVGFMTHAQILDLQARGNELGAHTRTHPDLTTLTQSQMQDEICGSRQDLLSWGASPVATFAYPFGAYDATTDSVVRSCGFSSAATSNGGFVTTASDPYQLERQSIQNTTTLAQVKQWVDSAAANHTWLIMEFHGIENTGDQYSMTPALFNQVVDYVQQKGIPVVTISQGAAAL